jgi:serine protease Do
VASWGGKLLTPPQVTTLQNQISADSTLTPGQIAIVVAALRNDRELKSQQAANPGRLAGALVVNDSAGDPSTNALIPSSFQVAMLAEAVAVAPPAPDPTSSRTEAPASKPAASTVEVAATVETNTAPADDGPVYGMKITELDHEGTAAKEGLLVGDVILAINGQATPNFEEVRSALEKTGNKAEVIFLNKDNGKVERIVLRPVETRIGASVEAVQVR